MFGTRTAQGVVIDLGYWSLVRWSRCCGGLTLLHLFPSFTHLMTSGDAETREGAPHSWDGGMASPTMEEHFYPFLIERRPSYLEEDEEGRREEDLGLALERKDKDLLLAAELGKALLERNDYLEKEREALEEELRETRERLEQEKHALRLRMEAKDGEWKAQITDLESDLSAARQQIRQLTAEHRECGRESASAAQELSEQNQRLLEQLAQVSQVESSLTLQLESLREENRELTLRRGQFAPVLQSLQSENALLLEKKRDMESQIKTLREDNERAQSLMFHLKETVLQLERWKNETEAKMQEKLLEVEGLRDSQRSLQIQVGELQDELKMRDSHFALQDSRYSLHSELQETSGVPEHESTSMNPSLQFEGHTFGSESHMSTYKTQREREMIQEKEEEIGRLQDVVNLQHIEIKSLQEELQKLRKMLQQNDHDSVLRQAVSDRDEAIMKKGELELELAKCRLEKESMSRQLLSAVEQKVLLSQELEAWEDDMQIVINQQLKSQREQERTSESSPSTPTRRDSRRRPRDGGSGIFSIFKRL
ncbi:BICD family-like cargo adapter 2 [Bufo bufo]|uniref:BICD family-like cargo adapter 2 n=1 Tax=Bufo bufo TaxID=8384 RepID=UPI001ABE56CC|nr:BICD family-like cargo adapter 2 [Bufo bufo]